MRIINISESDYPERLRKIKNPPKKIYIEGDEKLLNKNCLAIVGTRNATEYGIRVAYEFAKKLSQEGICIVSGLAKGIDSYAHLGAKCGKGRTIAVLGCGFKHIYPEHNFKLYKEILCQGGCIISEYEPEQQYKSEYFPARNRIISGISMGVLIVEGRYRSGSSITGRLAIEQQKEVFCIPGNIDQKTSYVPNEFIKNGAYLVTKIEEILEFFPKEEEAMQIDNEFFDIYKYLSDIPTKIEELVGLTDLSVASINEKLLLMEIEGLIKSVNGGYVKA